MHVCRFNGTAAEPLKAYIVSALRMALYARATTQIRTEINRLQIYSPTIGR